MYKTKEKLDSNVINHKYKLICHVCVDVTWAWNGGSSFKIDFRQYGEAKLMLQKQLSLLSDLTLTVFRFWNIVKCVLIKWSLCYFKTPKYKTNKLESCGHGRMQLRQKLTKQWKYVYPTETHGFRSFYLNTNIVGIAPTKLIVEKDANLTEGMKVKVNWQRKRVHAEILALKGKFKCHNFLKRF